MHLVEIFLPVADNEGRPFQPELYAEVEEELIASFGGVTSFTRAPARGVTREGGGKVRDEIVVLEVMTDVLDREWWRSYRHVLEGRFRQDEILIRVSEVIRL